MIEYIVISVLLLAAELVYFKIADKCNIIDKPNERSSHTRIVLRGGRYYLYHCSLGVEYLDRVPISVDAGGGDAGGGDLVCG